MTARRVRPTLWAALVLASAVAAVLGFAREAAVAALFGASRQADAFYAALSLPFFAAHFLVGGALTPPLTAALAALLEREERASARAFLARAATGILAATVLAALATALLSGPVTRVLVPGFSLADRALTGSLLVTLWVYGGATALALAGGAALAAAGAYRTPVVAFAVGNALALGVLVLLRENGITALVWALNAGALLQLALVAAHLSRLDMLGLPKGPAGMVSRFPLPDALWLGLALAAAGAVDLLERPFASAAGAGAVALLAYAGKLVHLPMRIVAAPLASVALPRLVRGHVRADQSAPREAGATANRIFLLLAWCAATTAAAALSIAAITFGRGRFGPDAVERLATLLRLLAPAVVAIGLVEVLSKYLLAHGRARAVAAAQGAGLLVYVCAASLLSRHGAPGLAGARALAWTTAAAGLAIPLVVAHRELGLLVRAPWVIAGALLAAGAAALLVRYAPGPRFAHLATAALAAAVVLVAFLGICERLLPSSAAERES